MKCNGILRILICALCFVACRNSGRGADQVNDSVNIHRDTSNNPENSNIPDSINRKFRDTTR